MNVMPLPRSKLSKIPFPPFPHFVYFHMVFNVHHYLYQIFHVLVDAQGKCFK